MPDIIEPILFDVDLARRKVVRRLRGGLSVGDRSAAKVILKCTQDGQEVDLTGVTAYGRFFRPGDGAEIRLNDDTINKDTVTVALIDECFAAAGYFEMDVVVVLGDVHRTLVTLSGEVHTGGSGELVDIDGVVPSLDDILAQYATMQQVTQDATAAKNAANTAASNADAKATAAQTAADAANSAAGKINNMTVSATTLAAGSSATATITESGGKKNISFGIPKGEKGDKGDKGDPGEAAGVAEDSTLLGGKAPAYYIQPHNYCDNGNFKDAVNQYGLTDYTTYAYCIDRWSKGSGKTVTIGSDGLTITAGSDGSNVISQYIADLPDGTYTFALKTKAGNIGLRCYTKSGSTMTSIDGTSVSYGTGYIQAMWTSSKSAIAFQLRTEAGMSTTFEWAAVYPGQYTVNTMPPYVPKDYATELTACKMHRLVYPTLGTFAVAFALGIVQTATTARFSLDLPGEMRIDSPSIAVTGVSWSIYTNGQNITPTDVTVLRASGSKLYLQATATGMTPGETACLVFKSTDSNTGYVTISADV